MYKYRFIIDFSNAFEISTIRDICSSLEAYRNLQSTFTHCSGSAAWSWVYDKVVVNPKGGDEQKTFNDN